MKKAVVNIVMNALALVFVPVIIYDQMVIRAKNALGKYQNKF